MFKKMFQNKNLSKDRQKKPSGQVLNFINAQSGSVVSYTKQEVINRYNTTPYLKVCVDKIANGCATSKLTLHKKLKNGGDKILSNSDVIDLIKKPNELMGGKDFIRTLVGCMELYGEVFIYLEKFQGKIIYMYVISPNQVVQKPSKASGFKYRINIDGKLYLAEREDVVAIKDFDYSNLYGNGSSKANSVGANIQTNNEITKYLQTYFNNSCVPNGIISLEDVDNIDDIEQIKQDYNINTSGFSRFKTYFINKKLTYTKTSANLSELGIVELQEFEQKTIRNAFCIPEELMGNTSNTNRSGSLVAKDTFISEVLQPRMEQILEVINIQIVQKYYGEDLFFTSSIESDSSKEMTIKLITACPSAFTLNEVREISGYDTKIELEGKFIDKMKKESGVNSAYESDLIDQGGKNEKTNNQ